MYNAAAFDDDGLDLFLIADARARSI